MRETATLRIDIVSDVVCPWCYLGKRLLEAALAQRPDLEARVVWRPYQLNPNLPAEGVDREAYLAARIDPARRSAITAELLLQAEALGLALNLAAATVMPNSFDAHRLLSWAQGQGRGMVAAEALFSAYFHDGRNIGDRATLIEISQAVGLDPELVRYLYVRDSDRDKLTADLAQVAPLGQKGVPAFVFGGKVAVLGAQPVDVLLKAIDQVSGRAAA